jgi:hypothetical protein
MELKLYINQTITYNTQGDRIYYVGNNPLTLRAELHKNVPFPALRSFPNNPKEIDVSDLYKLKLSWAINKDVNGVVVAGASQLQKSASGTLTFEGEAYRLLKQWLIDDISAPLNSVDVKLPTCAGAKVICVCLTLR